jgi:RNA polymerase sigma-70 factor (ECF subfamily)
VIPGGSAPEPTEADLVRAFAEGEVAALGTLIKRHQVTVLKVVRRYARTPDEAKDLAQRAFLQALEAAQRTLPKLAPQQHEVPFKAWLLRIAVNLGKNHVRDAGRWVSTTLDAPGAERPTLVSAHDALERVEQEALTRRAVLELPPRQREVFTLRIDAGLPFGEIAETLGITEGNAKAHFHHAVKRLKDEVARLSNPKEDAP